MRVLIIDGDEAHLEAFRRSLSRIPGTQETCYARTAEQATLALTMDDDETPWDLVCLGAIPGVAEVCEHVTVLPHARLPRRVVCCAEGGTDNAKMLQVLWSVAYVRAVATPWERKLAWLPAMLAEGRKRAA